MFVRRFLPVLLLLALPACSATVAPIQLTAEHPASPLAAEAPVGAASSVLAAPKPMSAESVPAPEAMDHSMHGMTAAPEPTAAPMDHSQHGMAPTDEAADLRTQPEADHQGMDPAAHETVADDDPPPADGGQR